MFTNSRKYLLVKSSRCGDRLSPCSNIIITTLQPRRLFGLTEGRCKQADLNSQNYYDILGLERTASRKDIRKAFLRLSKEYHPDSNAADKSLHSKFVKINEAFSILSKESTRTTYDQTLNPSYGSSYQSYSRAYRAPGSHAYNSSQHWTNNNFSNQGSYRQQNYTYDDDWERTKFDKSFIEMLRRRMKYDRYHGYDYSYNTPPSVKIINAYFAPFAIISFLIGFGVLIHALQWRVANYSDPTFASDPRTRSYQAYREWQRLSALEDAESIPMRDRSKRRDQEK